MELYKDMQKLNNNKHDVLDEEQAEILRENLRDEVKVYRHVVQRLRKQFRDVSGIKCPSRV